MKIRLFGLLLSAFLVSASAHALSLGGAENPSRICLVGDGAEAVKTCKNGDMMIMMPNMFGNEQFPVLVAGAFCDFSAPIVYSVGAVSCVFSDARKKSWSKFNIGK